MRVKQINLQYVSGLLDMYQCYIINFVTSNNKASSFNSNQIFEQNDVVQLMISKCVTFDICYRSTMLSSTANII